MRRFAALLGPISLLLSACGGDTLLPPDVVARVGGREIAYADFERYLRENSVDLEVALEGAASSQLFDQYLEEELLRELAADRGLVEEGARATAALAALFAEEGADSVEPAEIEAYYRDHSDAFRQPERVRLRQILVADLETAVATLAELDAGADFARVATRASLGPAAARGGDQGVLGRDDLPPNFIDTVFSLAEGRHSRVVTADYGYHIFQVIQRWPATEVPLERAAPEIRERLAAERRREVRARLAEEARERYNPRVDERNLPFRYEGVFR